MKNVELIKVGEVCRAGDVMLGYEVPKGKDVELFGCVRYEASKLPCPFVSVVDLQTSQDKPGRVWAIRLRVYKYVTQPLVIDVLLRDCK